MRLISFGLPDKKTGRRFQISSFQVIRVPAVYEWVSGSDVRVPRHRKSPRAKGCEWFLSARRNPGLALQFLLRWQSLTPPDHTPFSDHAADPTGVHIVVQCRSGQQS